MFQALFNFSKNNDGLKLKKTKKKQKKKILQLALAV